jgi:hypothetical protein
MAQQSLVDHGLLIVKVSRLRSDTPHSVGFLWTRDQLDAETHSQETDTHVSGGIRTRNPHQAAIRARIYGYSIISMLFQLQRGQAVLNLSHVIKNNIGFGEQKHGVTRHQGCVNSWSIAERS